MDQDYQRIHTTEAPESMTMNRLGELNELVVAQTTQLCFRKGCCTPSINWVLLDSSNYDLQANGPSYSYNNNNTGRSNASNPFELPSVGGWIHEESTFFQRCCCHAPGCRETRFVHHAGLPPASLGTEDCHFCVVQTTPYSSFLKPSELTSNVIAIHEKDNTCPTDCCCAPGHLPYLRTKDAQGRYLGETRYVCDGCIFVPKFMVLDKHTNPKYLLRPDTCWAGLCMMPRCGGRQGKCCRLPFLIRDPITGDPIKIHSSSTADGEDNAQITQLWSGLANELCFRRHAYHVAFPDQHNNAINGRRPSGSTSADDSCSVEDKLVLIGASILVDVALFEKNDDDK